MELGDLARRAQFVRDRLGKRLPHVVPTGRHPLDRSVDGCAQVNGLQRALQINSLGPPVYHLTANLE